MNPNGGRHSGSGAVILNADRGSRSYGKILLVHESRGYWTTPGGAAEPQDRDYMETALRETAEETVFNDRDHQAIQVIISELRTHLAIDGQLSGIRTITTKAGKVINNGFVYGILTKNNAFPGPSLVLPGNKESLARQWFSLSEIKALGSKFGGGQDRYNKLEKDVQDLAARHQIALAP